MSRCGMHLQGAIYARFVNIMTRYGQLRGLRGGDRIVSGSVDQIAYVWEATSGNVLTTYMLTLDMLSVSDWLSLWYGPLIVSISLLASADKTVHIWNAQTADNHSFHGHSAEVNAVAWSPDSQYIATASDDKTVPCLGCYCSVYNRYI